MGLKYGTDNNVENIGYGLGSRLSTGDVLSSGLGQLGGSGADLSWLDKLKGLGSIGGKDAGLGTGLGMNVGTAQAGLAGLQAIMGFMGASKANKLANKQFKFTKDVTNTNLANQIQSYNTALTDRSNTRAVMEGRDQASSDRYIEQNRLRR